MAKIQWFEEREGFMATANAMQTIMATQDAEIARSSLVNGHCPACEKSTVFRVGAASGGAVNLREGMFCEHCELNGRQRLMTMAMRQEIARLASPRRGLLLERTTRLYRLIHSTWYWIYGSEYLGDDRVGGRHYWWSARRWRWWRARPIRHESITALSVANETLDLIAHSDVLEHVYDTRLAASESARALRIGGVMVFTVPFALNREKSLLRGRPLAGGSIEHLETPEYHGDGISRGGAYTFHHFGWDLLDVMRDAGFSRVEIGLCHAPAEGIASADPGEHQVWHVPPLLFRAVK